MMYIGIAAGAIVLLVIGIIVYCCRDKTNNPEEVGSESSPNPEYLKGVESEEIIPPPIFQNMILSRLTVKPVEVEEDIESEVRLEN